MSDVAPAAPAAEAVPAAPVAPEVPTGTAPEAPPPEKMLSQAEVDALIKKKDAKRLRERDELRREVEVLRKLALERGERQQAPAQQPQQPDSAEPKRENYGSYEDYLDAKAEYRAEKAVEKRLAKQREDDEKNRTASEKQKQAEDFKSRAKKLTELEDFDEVMQSSESPMTEAMAKAIYAAGDEGPRVAYHLAKDREEAERIASLPEVLQAREIVLLEMKLKAAPAKSPSRAPAPITPVGGKGGPSSDEPSDSDNTNTWIEKENKRVMRKSKA